jgi:hypothetical protein
MDECEAEFGFLMDIVTEEKETYTVGIYTLGEYARKLNSLPNF